jgi:hypothetical protein
MKKLVMGLLIAFVAINLNAQTVTRYNNLNKTRISDGTLFYQLKEYSPTTITYDTTSFINSLQKIDIGTKLLETKEKLVKDSVAIINHKNELISKIGQSVESIQTKLDEINNMKGLITELEKRKEKKKELDSIKLELIKFEKEKKDLEEYKDKLLNQINIEKQKLLDVKSEYETQVAMIKKQSDSVIVELNKEVLGYVKDLYRRDSVQISADFSHATKSINDITIDLAKLVDSLKPDYIFSHVTIDTSKVRNITNKLIDLIVKANDCKHILSKNAIIIKQLEPAIKDYNSLGVLMQNLPEVAFAQIVKKEYPTRKSHVNVLFSEYLAADKEFKKAYDELLAIYKTEVAIIKADLKTEKKETTDAALLANFTKPLSSTSTIIPEINVLASKAVELDDFGILAQTKLFISATGSDTNKINPATNFFIPEASQLGFMADFTFSFINAGSQAANSKKKMGVNLGFYYLQKQLLATETGKEPTTFSVGALQARIGVEYILIKNMLAVYGRMNGIHVSGGVSDFKKYYNGSDKLEWFSELGLLSYLNLTSDKTTNILLEFRFIPVNSYVKSITQTNEPYLSLFKVGIVKDFKF